jgi:endonuclease YncB( thermonuclease family)
MNLLKFSLIILLATLGNTVFSHSGGLNKDGCHAGSKPYHCHRKQDSSAPNSPEPGTKITGMVTHVRDGDTVEVNGVAIRLSALNCPENGTQKGNFATKVAKQFEGMKMTCELTGAKTYDRLVGYCSANGIDFGRYMMQNSSCKVWEKYDVWDRY